MKKRTLNLFITLFSALAVLPCWGFDLSKSFQGYVSIRTKEIYVNYIPPEANKETVVLLNGLNYTTDHWSKLVVELTKKGLGVLRYDMDGMGKTLIRQGIQFAPYKVSDQVDDLNQLLKTIRLKAPYNIAGLSYGGGIASAFTHKYPSSVKKVILMAPYTEALEQTDAYLNFQVALARFYFPFNPATNDEIYDYYLQQYCYSTYPIDDPSILTIPYGLEGLFRLTQGIRKYKVYDEIERFPAKSVHLMIAEFDQLIPRQTLTKFWDAIPEHARASLTILKDSTHKIPEVKPVETAIVIDEIVSGSYQGFRAE